eukprot:1903980-Prymnesium_polylepis.1
MCTIIPTSPALRWPAQATSAVRMSQPERDIVQDYVLSDDLDHLLDDQEVSLPFSLSHLPAALAEDVLLEDLWMDVELDRDDMPDEFCPKSSQSFIDYNFVADCARAAPRAPQRIMIIKLYGAKSSHKFLLSSPAGRPCARARCRRV